MYWQRATWIYPAGTHELDCGPAGYPGSHRCISRWARAPPKAPESGNAAKEAGRVLYLLAERHQNEVAVSKPAIDYASRQQTTCLLYSYRGHAATIIRVACLPASGPVHSAERRRSSRPRPWRTALETVEDCTILIDHPVLTTPGPEVGQVQPTYARSERKSSQSTIIMFRTEKRGP